MATTELILSPVAPLIPIAVDGVSVGRLALSTTTTCVCAPIEAIHPVSVSLHRALKGYEPSPTRLKLDRHFLVGF